MNDWPWLIHGGVQVYRPHSTYIVDTDSTDTPPPSNDENLDRTLQKIAAAFGMDLEVLKAEAARLMHQVSAESVKAQLEVVCPSLFRDLDVVKYAQTKNSKKRRWKNWRRNGKRQNP